MISKMIFVGFVDLHRIAKINPVATANWRNPTKTVSGSLTGEYCVNCGGMSFLINALETVFVSWHLGLLDDSTIEEQFEYLRIPGKGDGLANFRHAAGGYPITETFIDRIKEKPKTNHKKHL